MMGKRSVLPLMGIVAAAVLFVGCDAASSHISILRGNYQYSRGDFQEATVA